MALEYGATIVYTSGKSNINLTVLYDYICHILFNFELVHKPNFIEKEAYYIPAGHDDLTLLNSNEEIKKYMEESFEERIKPEINEKQIIEEDIQCEDTNTFFETLKMKGVKGKDIIQKSKTKETTPSIIEQKKTEINKKEINNQEKEKEKDILTKIEKEKKFEEKKKDVKERLAKKAGIITHNTEDKKEKKVISKADEEKKNKTRENMLAKLKLKKKDGLKKK